MIGLPRSNLKSKYRWRWSLSFCLWVKWVPFYLLMVGFLQSADKVSSTGLERPKYRTAYACEGSTLNMDCDRGHVINLIRANYGRFSITICNEHGNTEWSVNCMSLRSHRVLHDRCSQRQNCSVPASTRGFGDPCPGTLKYLEAHFQCVPVNPPSHTVRPRPPWFLATKTTVSTITEDQVAPHDDSPFPRDPPQGMFPEFLPDDSDIHYKKDLNDEVPIKLSSSTSTTTTLRPPPWLITNSTKNVTSVSSTASTSTSTTPVTTTSVSTTVQMSQKSDEEALSPEAKSSTSTTVSSVLPPNIIEGSKGSDPKEIDDVEIHDDDGVMRKIVTSTISTTTLWSPQAEVPSRGVGDESSWCPPSSGRGLFWNWTRSGEVAVQSCPGGASGWATRPCAPRGWVSPPDLGDCRSVWLSSLLTRTKSEAESKDGALAVAQDLTKVTRSRKLYGGDITATARLVGELTRRMGEDLSSFPDGAQREALVTELVEEALKTVSNLIVWQKPAWGDLGPAEHNAALNQLLLGIEETAFFLADNIHHEKTISFAASNILMRLQVLETRNVARVTFPTHEDPWPSQESPSPYYQNNLYADGETYTLSSSEVPSTTPNTQSHLQDFITLPPEALLENSDNGLVKMVFFSYKGLENLLQPEKNYGYVEGNFQTLNKTRILNSRVVSASLGAGRHIELSEPVYITFAMIRTTNVSNPACVFWDYTTNSWSEEGCRVLLYNITHTTCQCDHLTNFAVLMDMHATPISPEHQVALSIITYVGCVISIVGLLLATIVFHAFKGLKSDRTTIHKNLCICLLLGEAIFLGGITRTDQPLVCSIIAGFLHYFFLAAFAWMLLEGFQLYIMLIEVFEAEKSRVRWYYAAAYGFPAVVVAISAFIDPYSYGTDTVCWLRTDNYFIFAFVGPVLLVLVANSIFLALSLVLMCRHAHNSAVLKNKETSKLATLRSWLKGAIILMFLLGLTWTFGLLYLDEASLAMAYVFTCLNSLQGIFIFVFHCLQNDKVKTETHRLCRRHTWLRACLCYSRTHSTPTASSKTDAHNSQLAHSQASNSLMSGFASGRWRRRSSAGSIGACPPNVGNLREGTVTDGTIGSLRGRSSLIRTSHNSMGSRASRHAHSSLRHAHLPNHDQEEEKYSFKSCGRDSGHGGSEQEESPRTGPPTKLSSLRLNNNVSSHQAGDRPHIVNPFAAAAALEHALPTPVGLLPDYRLAGDVSSLRYQSTSLPGVRVAHRNQSPWNHTYTEIPDGIVVRPLEAPGPDPVYEEIEREGRSEIQVSDMSDEDGRRQSSDISRQSSRSYGDHRPLLPYTLPDRNCPPALQANDPRFQQRLRQSEAIHMGMADNQIHHPSIHPSNRIQPPIDHTIVSAGHILPLAHPTANGNHALPPGNGHIGHPMVDAQYQEAIMAAMGHNTVVQPLSEPNLRSWEAVQRHRDLQQLQHLGEMTVAVLNGEQVVCKLKSPLAPIHENSSSQATTVATATVGAAGSGNSERYLQPQTYSHC